MQVRRKVVIVGAVLGIAMVGGAGSASALSAELPNGKVVTAPDAAVPGVVNAFLHVRTLVDDHPIEVDVVD